MSNLPAAHAVFPTLGNYPVRILSFELLRQPYAFDSARLTTSSFSETRDLDIAPGTPMYLQWGEIRSYGYVYAVRPAIDQLQRQTTILMTGVQSAMSWTRKTRTHPSLRAHEVVAEIVDDYLIPLLAKPLKDTIPEPEQDDTNDWQFICDTARRVGYVVVSRGSTIVFAPVTTMWEQALSRQTPVSTFRNALSPGSTVAAFERDDTLVQSALVATSSSAFGADADVSRLTNKFWKGSKSKRALMALFPSSAKARLLGPEDIFPFDAFEVTLDQDVQTWSVFQIKYVLTMDDYYAEVVFVGQGQALAQRFPSTMLDIGAASDVQTLRPTRPRLRVRMPVFYNPGGFGAHWYNTGLQAPGTEETRWLTSA